MKKFLMIVLAAAVAAAARGQAAETTTQGKIYEVSELDTPPRVDGNSYKAFPAMLLRQMTLPKDAAGHMIEGEVKIGFIIDKLGDMTDLRVVSASDPALGGAVRDALASPPVWEPGVKDGVGVNTRVKVTVKIDAQAVAKSAIPDVKPKFGKNGGLEEFRRWVMSGLVYPKDAAKERVSGRVVLSFVIEKTGEVSSIRVLESPDIRLSDEAVRVVRSSPKWTPGIQAGDTVKVKYTLPVEFRIP